MKILSIETSCDDTGVTILEAEGGPKSASFRILADNLSSQAKVHIPFGGVYPMLAKREHIKNLPIVLEKTLREARIFRERGLGSATARTRGIFQQKNIRAESTENPGLDVIAVTYGPGLEPALWTGITFAQELAKKWRVPVVPVNHMEGHVLSVFGKDTGKFKIPKVKTPILSLLVSGGHTQLVLSRKWMQYEIIGETLDDAVGEAFDKVARMLGLPYPGGPQISKLAEKARSLPERGLGSATARTRGIFQQKNIRAESGQISRFSLPRPMLHSKDFNFSFSGLKTAVLYLTRKIGKLDEKTKAQIALEFENAAVECLVFKTAKAIEKYKVKTLIVAGGVAANKHLRKEMQKISKKVLFPTGYLSGDNSLMIGIAGYLNYIKNKKKVPKLGSIKATGNLKLN
jgi:N6-L-threonylcarbamoyladenine synthase